MGKEAAVSVCHDIVTVNFDDCSVCTISICGLLTLEVCLKCTHMSLCFYGPSRAFYKYIEGLRKTLKVQKKIDVLGPLWFQHLYKTLSLAKLAILPR